MSGPKQTLISYDRFFNFNQMLEFLKPRAIGGIELVTGQSYARTFRMALQGESNMAQGYFKIENQPEQSALKLTVCSTSGHLFGVIQDRVRSMFDLDRDFVPINRLLLQDRRLAKGMNNGHVPRLPVAFDPFELVIRAILGQQITVKAATTLASRIAEKAGKKTGEQFPEGLDLFFPDPAEIKGMALDGCGITRTRQETIKTVSEAVLGSALNLIPDQEFESFYRQFSALKGIGDWTVNYVAMRGLGMVDAFPASDLGVIKALTEDDQPPSVKKVCRMAEDWRPFRAYAALCLWNR